MPELLKMHCLLSLQDMAAIINGLDLEMQRLRQINAKGDGETDEAVHAANDCIGVNILKKHLISQAIGVFGEKAVSSRIRSNN